MHVGIGVGRFDQGTDRGGCSVENRRIVLLDHVPEAAGVRVGRDAFEHDLRRAGGQRAVRNIRVTGDPANVGGTPEDVGRLDVEGPFHREHRPQQVAAGRMLHAFRGAGGAGCVEDE